MARGEALPGSPDFKRDGRTMPKGRILNEKNVIFHYGTVAL
jgi:hypothetical protein